MYIPDTIPSTLEEMYDFLTPSVTDGLFDSIEYDNDSNPSYIKCIQDDNIICLIENIGNRFNITPYIRDQQPDSYATWGDAPITFAVRCKHGICLRANVSSYYFYFIFSKTNAGKTGIIAGTMSPVISVGTKTIRTSCFGDDINNNLYISGFNFYPNGSSDRTIFNIVPVTGNASNNIDYYTGCLLRNCYQFAEDGEQIINNKKYYCVNSFAILDE